MTSRVDKARAAFTKVYEENLWGLDAQPPQLEPLQRVATLIGDTIRKYQVQSVVEFGCGFWNYAKLVDWRGVTYDGYDVSHHPVRFNADAYGTADIRFHQFEDGVQLAPADLLITKDVLQHLPIEDIQHYLALFKQRFSYLLILNATFPDDNLNGQIEHGDFRALRLDLPPFNEKVEVIDEWDNPLFGVPYRNQACVLRGNGRQPAPETWVRKVMRRMGFAYALPIR